MQATIDDVLETAEVWTAPDTLGELEPDAAAVAAPMTRRRVLSLATPIIGENLLQTAVGVVDTLLVARLGAWAVAGVGTGFEIVFFIIAILSAIDVGATVLVAQAIGAGDRQRANDLARQAIVWGLLLAAPLSVGMYLAAPTIIGLFGTAPDVAAAATTYFQIIAVTSVGLFLSFVCGAVLRGAGDSRTPLVAATIANVVNLAVSYALVLGNFGFPALGVAGVAIGAAVARGVGAAFLLAVMASGRTAISLRGGRGWRPRLDVARRLFALGIPAALEQVLSSGAFMTLVAVVAVVGTSALAAQQIAFTALSTAFLPGIGFMIATTALVGQSIGARNPTDARKAWTIALRWAVSWLAIGGGLVALFAEPLMRVFTSDPAVVGHGVAALRAVGLVLPFWAVWFVSGGALRGSGDTRTPLLIGASAMWLSVALAFVGVRWFGAGLGWVWVAFGLVTSPAALLMWWIFRRRVTDYEAGRRPLPAVAGSVGH